MNATRTSQATLNLMNGTGYLFFSGLLDYGDWAVVRRPASARRRGAQSHKSAADSFVGRQQWLRGDGGSLGHSQTRRRAYRGFVESRPGVGHEPRMAGPRHHDSGDIRGFCRPWNSTVAPVRDRPPACGPLENRWLGWDRRRMVVRA